MDSTRQRTSSPCYSHGCKWRSTGRVQLQKKQYLSFNGCRYFLIYTLGIGMLSWARNDDKHVEKQLYVTSKNIFTDSPDLNIAQISKSRTNSCGMSVFLCRLLCTFLSWHFLFVDSQQRTYQLRVDMWDWEGGRAYAQYDVFKVDSERQLYKLHVGHYSGNAGRSSCLSPYTDRLVCV